MRDEKSAGVSSEQLVREACSIADGYIKKPGRKKAPPLAYILSGAAGTGVVWLVTSLISAFLS
jgi:hypothetical protein